MSRRATEPRYAQGAARLELDFSTCQFLLRLNLILFERAEIAIPLPRADRRAVHLLEVLRRQEGDTFDAGIINGPRGKGTLDGITRDALSLTFSWAEETPALSALTLVVGLPRPQTARSILRDLASLGVGAMHFVRTDKGDPNYGLSALWHSGEWRRHALAGIEQAFCTRLPTITHGETLKSTIAAVGPVCPTRIALDNYESDVSLDQLVGIQPNVLLAIGPERGWSTAERELLRLNGFNFSHLGRRVLRTETACIAAVTLVKARLGWL